MVWLNFLFSCLQILTPIRKHACFELDNITIGVFIKSETENMCGCWDCFMWAAMPIMFPACRFFIWPLDSVRNHGQSVLTVTCISKSTHRLINSTLCMIMHRSSMVDKWGPGNVRFFYLFLIWVIEYWVLLDAALVWSACLQPAPNTALQLRHLSDDEHKKIMHWV